MLCLIQDAPLLRQLLLSGAPDQAGERLWLLRLLAAGFQGPADGDIFRCPCCPSQGLPKNLCTVSYCSWFPRSLRRRVHDCRRGMRLWTMFMLTEVLPARAGGALWASSSWRCTARRSLTQRCARPRCARCAPAPPHPCTRQIWRSMQVLCACMRSMQAVASSFLYMACKGFLQAGAGFISDLHAEWTCELSSHAGLVLWLASVAHDALGREARAHAGTAQRYMPCLCWRVSCCAMMRATGSFLRTLTLLAQGCECACPAAARQGVEAQVAGPGHPGPLRPGCARALHRLRRCSCHSCCPDDPAHTAGKDKVTPDHALMPACAACRQHCCQDAPSAPAQRPGICSRCAASSQQRHSCCPCCKRAAASGCQGPSCRCWQPGGSRAASAGPHPVFAFIPCGAHCPHYSNKSLSLA